MLYKYWRWIEQSIKDISPLKIARIVGRFLVGWYPYSTREYFFIALGKIPLSYFNYSITAFKTPCFFFLQTAHITLRNLIIGPYYVLSAFSVNRVNLWHARALCMKTQEWPLMLHCVMAFATLKWCLLSQKTPPNHFSVWASLLLKVLTKSSRIVFWHLPSRTASS